MKNQLARLAQKALAASEFKAFGDALATQPLPESFGVFSDRDLTEHLIKELGEDPTKWVIRPLTWDSSLYAPDVFLSPANQLLHLLWQDLNTRLARRLDAVARRTSLASKGAVLCFFGRADFSLIVEYRRSGGGAVSLKPLAAVAKPTGVLELANLFDGANAEVRNAIKNAALSVDKLVFQRGCIIHVDRQREDVFGPTIDSILLGELIAEWLNQWPLGHRLSALEVGPGSGLLSVILASSDHIGELTAVDLNRAAVTCTLKNLHINDASLDAQHQVVRVRAERFAADQFPQAFDFIVCNPPYIPGAPDLLSTGEKEYGRAVGGLELCTDILKNLPKLLSERGVLLLMASSLSDAEVLAAVPEGFEAVSSLGGDGRRVPLDVDVVWQRPSWQQWLLTEGRMEQDENSGLWHKLRPLWIRRKDEA